MSAMWRSSNIISPEISFPILPFTQKPLSTPHPSNSLGKMKSAMEDGPIFPIEELSPETYVKLPKKPTAESGSVKMYIICVEPNIYVEGFSKDEMTNRPPSLLRGALFIRISKPVKIKSINLNFTGVSRTEWPEGIPPKRDEYQEINPIINHTWPFFDYQYTTSANKGTQIFIPRTEDELHDFSITPMSSYDTDLHSIKSPSSLMSTLIGATSNSSQGNGNSKKKLRMKNVLLPNFKSNSSRTTDTNFLMAQPSNASSVNSTGGSDDAKLFPVGDYIYTFELPIQSSLPESIKVAYGSNKYSLEATIERSGKFKQNLYGKRMINVIRAPFQDSVEENQPIIINRDWENRLQYDIVIYSKQVVLNSYLPISFRMIPLEKVKVHRLRVYMTEHLDYYCHQKKVHRTEPQKKVLLLEHKPNEGMNDNLLALNEEEIGGMELDFQVFIPEIYGAGRKLNPECDTDNIQCHHWIKICIRISKSEPTTEDPDKRKQYELTIDSPMHLLSPLCAHANTLLPSYDDQIDMDNSVELATTGLDKMMSPGKGSILDSNMFKPNDDIPKEMLTPQAKPFSPIASPQLNAINPELRNAPTFKPIDMLEMLSPSNSSCTLNKMNNIPPPMIKRGSSSYLQSSVSLRAANPSPPPPPFAEHPPTYDEAVKVTASSTITNGTDDNSSNSSSKSLLGLSMKPKKVVHGPVPANAGISLKQPSNSRTNPKRHERDLSSFNDDSNSNNDNGNVEELHGLSFHITAIRSSDTSPSHSPVRPNAQNISKLISKNFTPAFSHNRDLNNDSLATLDGALSNHRLLSADDNSQDEDESTTSDVDVDTSVNGGYDHYNASMLTIDTLSTQVPIVQMNNATRRGSMDLLKLLKTQTEASTDLADM